MLRCELWYLNERAVEGAKGKPASEGGDEERGGGGIMKFRT